MDLTPPIQTRAETTERVLGVVFASLGVVLLGLGFFQLSYWLRGAATGPTIEPIVMPVGLIFAVAGVRRLLRVWRMKALATRGVDADAEVLAVTPTGKATDGQPWVNVRLRVYVRDNAPVEVDITWLVRPIDRLAVGARVAVRYLPERPRVVGLR